MKMSWSEAFFIALQDITSICPFVCVFFASDNHESLLSKRKSIIPKNGMSAGNKSARSTQAVVTLAISGECRKNIWGEWLARRVHFQLF